MTFKLRKFIHADTDSVNQVALSAFEQYRLEYDDWETISQRVGNMVTMAQHSEIIVATVKKSLAGAVAYVGPNAEKADFFNADWPIMRMLVVDPRYRGMGIGRALSQECIRRARRDSAPLIALHTSHMMKVALAMYERMGFRFEREAPPICGVPYGVYTLKL